MKYVIRIDDVCEFIDINKFKEFISFCNSHNIKGFLGYIPKCKDPKLIKYGKSSEIINITKDLIDRGWEISLHGFNHLYTEKSGGYMNSSKSEFIGLSEIKQQKIIEKGKEVLNKMGFENVRSFFAPSHGYDQNTIKALIKNNFNLLLDGYNPSFSNRHGINAISCIVDLPPNNFEKINTYHILCVHTNTFNRNSLNRYKKFIIENKNYFTDPHEVNDLKNNDNYIFRSIELIVFLLKYIKSKFRNRTHLSSDKILN